jgi:uncharacterized protein (TIGR02145 family)
MKDKKSRLYFFAPVLAVTVFINCVLVISCKKDHEDNTIPKDADGNVYRTIQIGSQLWMAENLRATHYRNGDVIPNVSGASATWNTLVTGACYTYVTTADDMAYGKLYNWNAVHDSRNIAPKGWHIPSDAEWVTLANTLGGINVAGGKLKETGTIHWLAPNSGATNEASFTALPGGLYPGSAMSDFRLGGYFFTTTSLSDQYAVSYHLSYGDSKTDKYTTLKYLGASVRCVKD